MRISDSDQSYVMTRMLFTGVCYGVAFTAWVIAGVMSFWSMDSCFILSAVGFGSFVGAEIFHRKAMDKLAARRASE